MPDGLKYILAAPGRQKFVVVLADNQASMHMDQYVQEVLTNFSDNLSESSGQNQQKKNKIHLIAYALTLSNKALNINVETYNFMKSPQITIEQIFEQLMKNVKEDDTTIPQILVIQDFSLLSLLSSNRDCLKMRTFLIKCSTMFQRIFIFSNQETLIPGEISKLYDLSSAVAILGSTSINQNTYICDLLKIKSRRISHKQTKYQVMNGKIIEIQDDSPSQDVTSKQQEDVLKTLTTFKLTVEDNEKESRSKLYLPYFDAQKITVEDPCDYDDYDDEDEEV